MPSSEAKRWLEMQNAECKMQNEEQTGRSLISSSFTMRSWLLRFILHFAFCILHLFSTSAFCIQYENTCNRLFPESTTITRSLRSTMTPHGYANCPGSRPPDPQVAKPLPLA